MFEDVRSEDVRTEDTSASIQLDSWESGLLDNESQYNDGTLSGERTDTRQVTPQLPKVQSY